MFTYDKLMEAMQGIPRSPVAGVKMVVVPDSLLPREHYADTLYIAVAHRFWFWLYRKLSWDTRTLYEVIRGYSRPLHRTTGTYMVNGVLYCTAAQAAEIRRELRAKDMTEAINRDPMRQLYGEGLFHGLFR
jgi:hypothetical protein